MELIDVNPAELLVDRNIREARLDETFVASVRDLGVLVPVVVARAAGGELRVRYGHRRTLAAIEAGLASVRVVVAGKDGDEAADQAQRLVEQWAENEHRAGLTAAEQVGAFEQLAALGLPAEEIARRTHSSRERVGAGLKVAQAPTVRAALAQGAGVDLIQAAILAEFDDDPQIVAALTDAAERGQLEHEAQLHRDDRAVAAETARLEAELVAAGVQVLAGEEQGDATALSWLDTQDGQRFTEDSHRHCPGHAGWVAVVPRWQWHMVTDEDAEAAGRCTVKYACTDPAAYGHQDRLRATPASRPELADLPEAERETERANRKDVIDSNKAWDSAQVVRRRWLAENVPARKTAPKGTAAFLARILTGVPHIVTSIEGSHYAATLLGQEAPQYGRAHVVAEQAGKASEARALVLTLTHVLACCETDTRRDDWRTRQASTVAYLQFLATMGYTLSDVETRAMNL